MIKKSHFLCTTHQQTAMLLLRLKTFLIYLFHHFISLINLPKIKQPPKDYEYQYINVKDKERRKFLGLVTM